MEDDTELTCQCVKKAWELGINFFDTAEVYGKFIFIQDMAKGNYRWARPYED
jgi:aryl-alcohol dehydrogenase-like predicted oxidoreductase